jgi:hypothetical protein
MGFLDPLARGYSGRVAKTMRLLSACSRRVKRLTESFLSEWRLQVCAVTSARLQTKFVTR